MRKVEINKRNVERGGSPGMCADQRDPTDRSWARVQFIARLPAVGDEKEVLLTAVSDQLQCGMSHSLSPCSGKLSPGPNINALLC